MTGGLLDNAASGIMKVFATGSLSDFLGDAVVYRSLQPVDRRLPGVGDLRGQLGLPRSCIPRKAEWEYGLVVSEILRSARRLQAEPDDLQSIVLLGDTERNDGGAFLNTCRALACPGGAFICDEHGDEPRLDSTPYGDGRTIWMANRWRLIGDFEADLANRGVVIGDGTAVIIDIDKTALGARGRNHRPIDEARAAAVLRTARGIRGDAVDPEMLMTAYERFNHPRFHPFTTDNQDYVAYVALIVESGWRSSDDLDDAVSSGRLKTFEDLLVSVSADVERLPRELHRVHDKVVAAVAAGDPTPFKDFRRSEYEETIARMRPEGGGESVEALLASRLTITHEVWRKALDWRSRGALLLGLSDKPDEASFPTKELEARRYTPLHRTPALVVGEDPTSITL